MKTVITLLAAALIAQTAHAAKPDVQTAPGLEGMALISDGLYARQTESGDAYVAINAAGMKSLAVRVEQTRQRAGALFAKDGVSPSEQLFLDRIQGTIDSLNADASLKATQIRGGSCPSGATLYTKAVANNGNAASAYAVNSLDFSPPTPTFNEASAYTDFNSDYVTATGLTPAQTSVSSAGSCISAAEARVTCPGQSTPASRAYASSWSNRPACLL